jgi:hypothetical protein
VRSELREIEEQLHTFLDRNAEENSPAPGYDRGELADFYVYINLQASILVSIDKCRESLLALDWRQLRESKF